MSRSFIYFIYFCFVYLNTIKKKQFFQIQILSTAKINPREINKIWLSAKINPREKIQIWHPRK